MVDNIFCLSALRNHFPIRKWNSHQTIGSNRKAWVLVSFFVGEKNRSEYRSARTYLRRRCYWIIIILFYILWFRHPFYYSSFKYSRRSLCGTAVLDLSCRLNHEGLSPDFSNASDFYTYCCTANSSIYETLCSDCCIMQLFLAFFVPVFWNSSLALKRT